MRGVIGSQEDFDRLSEQFSGFFDALVTDVALHLTPSRADRVATVWLLAEEGGTGASDSWRNVEFRIEGLRDYRFEEMPRSSHLVLSSGLHLSVSEEGVVLDLAPLSELPSSLDELRQSGPQFAAGASFVVSVDEPNT